MTCTYVCAETPGRRREPAQGSPISCTACQSFQVKSVSEAGVWPQGIDVWKRRRRWRWRCRGHSYRRHWGTIPRLVTAFWEEGLRAHTQAGLGHCADPRLPGVDTTGVGAGLLRRLSSGLTHLRGPRHPLQEQGRAGAGILLPELWSKHASVDWDPELPLFPGEVTRRAGQPPSLSADFATWWSPRGCSTGG